VLLIRDLSKTYALEGRVWRRAVPHSALDAYKARLTVLSTRLSSGKTIVHVLADGRPEEGFDAVAPDSRRADRSVWPGRV
jgi:hypothetical protein